MSYFEILLIVLGEIDKVELTIWNRANCGGEYVYVEITHEDSTCETGKVGGFYQKNKLLWSKTPTESQLDVWLNGIYMVSKKIDHTT